MCWLWLEHVKNTSAPHLSIYSIVPSAAPLRPPLPLCLFSAFFLSNFSCPHRFPLSLSPRMIKGFTSDVYLSDSLLPCYDYVSFGFVTLCLFSARGLCLIIAWFPLVSMSGVVFLVLSLPISPSDLDRKTEIVTNSAYLVGKKTNKT